jgi:hypothetical protein
LATTAMLVQCNGDSHELLGSRPSTDKTWAQDALSQWWDIHGREEAIKTLNWLWQEGHRGVYRTESRMPARVANVHTPLLAWDYCRLIWVAGVSYIAGYITEAEAWEKIMPAAVAIQANYSSWRQMGEDYLLGRERWFGHQEPKFRSVFRLLTNPSDPNSPWNKNPWSLALSEQAGIEAP